MDTDIDIVEDCKEERECKAACGYSAQDTRCNKKEPVGVCTCLNDYVTYIILFAFKINVHFNLIQKPHLFVGTTSEMSERYSRRREMHDSM